MGSLHIAEASCRRRDIDAQSFKSHDDHCSVRCDVTLSSVGPCSQLYGNLMMEVSCLLKTLRTPLRHLVMLLCSQKVAF
jgi:hypothetical protein